MDPTPTTTANGSLVLTLDATVLDIGLAGVALETDSRLLPDLEARLRIASAGGVLEVDARVVWCFFHGSRSGAGGEQLAVYRAGLEFVDVLTPVASGLMHLISHHAVSDGETRMFERFQLDRIDSVAVDLPAPFTLRAADGLQATVDSPLGAEPAPGNRVVLRTAAGEDLAHGHVADLERASDPQTRWRLTLALAADDPGATERLRALFGPA